MAETVYRIEEEGVETPITIPSFSEANKEYRVDLRGDEPTCECGRYLNRGHCVKHPVLAQAIARVREARGNTEQIEGDLFYVCREIFRPIHRHDTPAESYQLLQMVRSYYWSTPTMKSWAELRHKRVLSVTEAA